MARQKITTTLHDVEGTPHADGSLTVDTGRLRLLFRDGQTSLWESLEVRLALKTVAIPPSPTTRSTR